jgi:hypothetical protein
VREVRHPTVVLIGNVEGDFSRRARAVDEEGDSVGGGSATEDCAGFYHFADVDLGGLAGDRRDGGADGYVVVETQEAGGVVGERGGG